MFVVSSHQVGADLLQWLWGTKTGTMNQQNLINIFIEHPTNKINIPCKFPWDMYKDRTYPKTHLNIFIRI